VTASSPAPCPARRDQQLGDLLAGVEYVAPGRLIPLGHHGKDLGGVAQFPWTAGGALVEQQQDTVGRQRPGAAGQHLRLAGRVDLVENQEGRDQVERAVEVGRPVALGLEQPRLDSIVQAAVADQLVRQADRDRLELNLDTPDVGEAFGQRDQSMAGTAANVEDRRAGLQAGFEVRKARQHRLAEHARQGSGGAGDGGQKRLVVLGDVPERAGEVGFAHPGRYPGDALMLDEFVLFSVLLRS
jgi:hypothetical protein